MLTAGSGVNDYFQPLKSALYLLSNQSPLNIQRMLHRGSSTTSVRLAERKRSPDDLLRARVYSRADSASCRSKASPRMPDTSVDGPNMNRSSRILRIRADAAA